MNQIKKARMLAGLRQVDLAQLIGVRQITVCNWENGKSFPNVRKLPRLAEVLHTTVQELLEERVG